MTWLDRLNAMQKPEPNIFTPPKTEVSKVSKAPEPETIPTHCMAIKVGGRICGAPLKTGLNGWMSCSDMSCQAPVKNQKRN